jgi:hypothetical protein
MGGCRQGTNSMLLLDLSTILCVRVSGFTAMQRPAIPGDEGGRTTCYISCTRQGRSRADDFDDAARKVREWLRDTIARRTVR